MKNKCMNHNIIFFSHEFKLNLFLYIMKYIILLILYIIHTVIIVEHFSIIKNDIKNVSDVHESVPSNRSVTTGMNRIFHILATLHARSNQEQKLAKKYILNDWIGYRLGDVVNGGLARWGKKKDHDYLNNLQYKYKNSIAHEFFLKTGGYQNDKVLFEIINNRSINIDKLSCVIHIRLGDLFRNCSTHTEYKRSYESYQKLAVYLHQKHGLNKITIIGGAHYDGLLENSLDFVNKIINLFKRHNYTVNIRLGNHPDEDFLIMCNSKIFCKSGGGFSGVISRYVKYNNNTVIDPKDL